MDRLITIVEQSTTLTPNKQMISLNFKLELLHSSAIELEKKPPVSADANAADNRQTKTLVAN